MPFFIAIMAHPDGDGWNCHLAAHVAYLKDLVAAGRLRASGPLIGTPHRSGFLIFTVPDRAKVEALVAADPFAVAGLIENVTITEWDPLFGAFAAESSGHLPGLQAPLPLEV
ncbi:YciI family protein [Roseixanthobacter glucoisosaccharinicivorans]|uniref:YciI family protein n=1 Tax=Roseixanthobacter glucoisosaccharinicivorans TaxID=3119923 RepID=UPI00372A4E4D